MSVATATLCPTIGPDPLTPEWYAEHLTHITGSRAGGVCGVSEYTTPYHLYMELTGAIPPFEGNEATRRGQTYEAAIIADYAMTRGVEVQTPMPMYYHPIIPYLAATPDARSLGNEIGLVEAKYTMSPRRAEQLGEEGTDNVPDDWMLQAQAQMDTMCVAVCDIAVLLYGRLRIYRVERNQGLIDLYHEAAEELWQRIHDRNPPEPTWTHPKTPELIKTLHGTVNDQIVILSEATASAWTRQREFSQRAKECEEAAKLLKAQILHTMGDAAQGVMPDGKTLLIRSAVSKREYTVPASQFVTLREKKVKE